MKSLIVQKIMVSISFLGIVIFCFVQYIFPQFDKVQNEIIVAVIDTGIDISHQELKKYIWKNKHEMINGIDDDANGYVDDINGWNFCENSSNVAGYNYQIKENSHGTACAGIILQQYKAWKEKNDTINIKLVSLKVLEGGNFNEGTIENVKKAICYAETIGAKICNLSLGTEQYDEELFKTISDSKLLFVVAAGNDMTKGKDISVRKIYPAAFSCSNLIVVAGIDENNLLSKKSNYSKTMVDIAVPSENVYTTTADNDYAEVSGTSFAAPYITAVAAYQYEKHPNSTPEEIINKILEKAISEPQLKDKIKAGKILKKTE